MKIKRRLINKYSATNIIDASPEEGLEDTTEGNCATMKIEERNMIYMDIV